MKLLIENKCDINIIDKVVIMALKINLFPDTNSEQIVSVITANL